jgi:hypothetical protein
LLTFKELAKTADVVGGSMDRATLAALDLAAAGFGSAETNATQLGKALQDPIKGLNSLTKSGVTFTEQEREKIKALVASGKILEAQNLILTAIETQVGGTAEATATGSQKMALAFLAMQDALGNALIPVFEIIVPLVQDLFGFLEQNSTVVLILTTAMAALAVAILAVNFALNANPIVKVITLIGVLATGVVLLINYLVGLSGGWAKLFEGLQKGLAEVGKFFGTVFDAVSNLVVGVINGLATRFENFINTIIGGLNGIIALANAALAVVSTVTGGAVNIQVPEVPTVSIPKVPVKTPAKLPKKIPKLALGGIVMPQPGGVLANIAEAGQAEAVIPLNKMDRYTNNKPQNVYNITVSGGVGSGATIGKAIVDQIKAYERASGPVFAGA